MREELNEKQPLSVTQISVRLLFLNSGDAMQSMGPVSGYVRATLERALDHGACFREYESRI